MKDTLKIGPIRFGKNTRVLYAFFPDETSVQIPRELWNEEITEEHARYIKRYCVYAMEMMPSMRRGDTVLLDEVYQERSDDMSWLFSIWSRAGIEIEARMFFKNPEASYTAISKYLDEYSNVTTTSYSYMLGSEIDIGELLEISRYLNSKISLVEIAESSGLPIAPSSIRTVGELNYLEEQGEGTQEYYVKFDGLGGGWHVYHISNSNDLDRLMNDRGNEERCLVQEKVPEDFKEITISALAHAGRSSITNTRYKLVEDGNWYGNFFARDLRLSRAQESTINSASDWIARRGYGTDEGHYLGYDAFINGDELVVTEINARYLGSTPPERFLAEAGLLGEVDAIYFHSEVSLDELGDFKAFVEEHLYELRSAGGSGILPLAFNPYHGNGVVKVSVMVFGNIGDILEIMRNSFSENSFKNLAKTAAKFHQVVGYS